MASLTCLAVGSWLGPRGPQRGQLFSAPRVSSHGILRAPESSNRAGPNVLVTLLLVARLSASRRPGRVHDQVHSQHQRDHGPRVQTQGV